MKIIINNTKLYERKTTSNTLQLITSSNSIIEFKTIEQETR